VVQMMRDNSAWMRMREGRDLLALVAPHLDQVKWNGALNGVPSADFTRIDAILKEYFEKLEKNEQPWPQAEPHDEDWFWDSGRDT